MSYDTEALTAAAKQVVADARRLGLVWTMQNGTVTATSPVKVEMDGDNVSILVTSMIGAVTLGLRVYVIQVPPAGNFIVGFVGAAQPALGGTRLAVSGTPAVTSGNGLTTPAAESSIFSAWTSGFNQMTWGAGRVFRVVGVFNASNNLAGAGTVYAWSHYQVNFRSANGGSGTIIGASQDTSVQSGHLDDDKTIIFYLKNVSGADIISGVGVSIVKGASSIGATMSLDSALVTVEDIGDTTSPFADVAGAMA